MANCVIYRQKMLGLAERLFSGRQHSHAKRQRHIVRENQSWTFLQQFSASNDCEHSFVQLLTFPGLGASVFQVSNQPADYILDYLFIGPRCPWGPIYGFECLKQTSCTSYTSYRLYTEKVTVSTLEDSSWWIQLMQVVPSGGQIWN